MNSSTRKPRGLFVNPEKASCSIHESGRMVFECLLLSERYDLDYLEVSESQRVLKGGYDFYAFNYHHFTMGWLDTASLSQLPGLKLTFILETLPNDPFVLCPPNAFDAYCALDPTMKVADKRVYAFPRPLEEAPVMEPYQEPEIPVIGSFGFATQGKGFELVVEAVNREFDRAKVRINMPLGTYADAAHYHVQKRDYAQYLTELCQKAAKPGIEVEVTRDFMSKDELIQWCGQNTLNCFLYDRNSPGLSATTDQAISSGRPLSISENQTFRHIHPYLRPYPLRSLKASIALSPSEIRRMQEDWKPLNFARRFEKVLEDFHAFEKTGATTTLGVDITLAQVRKRGPQVKGLAAKVMKKLSPPLVIRGVQFLQSRIGPRRASLLPPRMQPFMHELVRSHSQFGEDLLIDVLLAFKNDGFYVDVGANEPVLNNNTKRFYDRGWTGINIEPGLIPFEELCAARPRDINLNIGVGSVPGNLTFYQISADPTLSSFDQDAAQRMATYFGHTVTPMNIDVRPLRDIFTEYVRDMPIDFLSVDAEGIDLDVLKSNDWQQFRPSLVLVEMNNERKFIVDYLTQCSYFLIFNNEYNGLFVDLRTSNPNLRSLLEKNIP